MFEFTGTTYFWNQVVEVGNEQFWFRKCGHLGRNNTAEQVDVVCHRPLVGRYVRIKSDSRYPVWSVHLCEVFVIGYQFEGMNIIVINHSWCCVVEGCFDVSQYISVPSCPRNIGSITICLLCKYNLNLDANRAIQNFCNTKILFYFKNRHFDPIYSVIPTTHSA